jgi:NHL repeat
MSFRLFAADVRAPRILGRRFPVAVLLAVGALVLAASPAFAISPVFSTTFGGPGSGAGQLSLTTFGPEAPGSGVAVNQQTGDVYVADTGNQRVVEFDSTGNFILAFGRSVDQTTGGDICTAASGDTCQAGAIGTGGGAFWRPIWIAVDNSSGHSSGDVYVGDAGTPVYNISSRETGTRDVISKFSAAGAYIPMSDNYGGGTSRGSFAAYTGLGLQGIAVDPDGNLWVYSNWIFEFSESGGLVQTLRTQVSDFSGRDDIAVDKSHVFLSVGAQQGSRLARFDTSAGPGGNGANLGMIGRGDTFASHIALDPSTEDLFTDNGGDVIDHYNASCAPVLFASNPVAFNAGCVANDSFGSGHLTDAAGLAYAAATSTLYVADAGADRIAVFVPPPPGPPLIRSQWSSAVASQSATLDAIVNANGDDTTCQLQYIDGSAFVSHGYTGATTVSCTRVDVGSRFADQQVLANLTGLAPGTTYHYRFLASNSAGTDTGADRTIATDLSEPALPDGRGYEQVSPVNKDSISLRVDGLDYQAAIDGDRMVFHTFNSYPGAASDGHTYLATRGPDGWSSTTQLPPQSPNSGGSLCIVFVGASAQSTDLSQTVISEGLFQQLFGCGTDQPALVPGEPADVQNLFLHDNVSGAYQLLSRNPLTGPPADAFFAAASPNFSHVVFQEGAQLTPDAPAGAGNLYESSGASLRLVSVAPNGAPLAGGGTITQDASAKHALSDDGSKIFFQGGDGNLYARVDGSRTLQLDASQAGGSGGGGRFQWASSDGSKVFFSDDAAAGLTQDTVPGSGQNLYRFDLSTGALTDLTSAADIEFLGLSGVSDSGADVYFVANGDLASGATSGAPNLYLSHGGSVRFIATLDPDPAADANGSGSCAWGHFGYYCARVAADGSRLAFNSDLSLTGADTGGFNEVYLYDRNSDHLVCASCAPSGARTTAASQIQNAPGFTAGLTGTSPIPHNLSADGSRLFFTADGPLLARDTNGKPDVYEYEDGKIHLISSGTSDRGSSFFDASASGGDVFFETAQRLTASDIDDATDVYDARVGGGFSQPPANTPCSGETCKGPGSTPPVPPTSASESFVGPGNAKPGSPTHPTAKARALSRSVHGTRFTVRLVAPGKGRIVVFGAGIGTVTKSVAKAGTYKLRLALTAGERRALRRSKRLTLTLKALYLPSNGAPSSSSMPLTVKA